MHAIRLARAFTGRSKLLKIEGNFHGFHDQVMFSIGTPADALGPEDAPAVWAGSTGIGPGLAEQLVVVPCNRPDLLETAIPPPAPEPRAVTCAPRSYTPGCI